MQRLKAVATVKSKKGRIRKVKYGVIIHLNPDSIDKVDRITGKTTWRISFELECSKLNHMNAFREMTDLEWHLGLF